MSGQDRGIPLLCLARSRVWFGVGSCRAEAMACSSILVHPCANRCIADRLKPAPGRVCLLCQLLEDSKELRRLADEQPVGLPGLDRGHCTPTPPWLGRANNRNDRELAAEEYGGPRHDQIRLEVLPAKGRGIEVRKHQPIDGVGQSRRIARLVMPGLKMGCLDWADTEQDAQDFQIADSLSQRWVEAGATLLDKPKMEARRAGDRLDVVSRGQVAIVSGNRRKLPSTQTRDGLNER